MGEGAGEAGARGGGLVTVYVTAPTRESARAIALAALDAKAAACANIVACESIFDWEGQREQVGEFVLFLKTTREAAPRLVEIVRGVHPYDVPCIEVLAVLDAHGPYAAWIKDSVTPS